MEKKYWFYIDSYVHISVKKNDVLFYNPYSGKILYYQNNRQIAAMTRKLQSPKQLLSIMVSSKDISTPDIKQFVSDIRGHYMGDLLDIKFSKTSPAQMPPIVKIQRDIDFLKKDIGRSIGEKIMEYLSEVSIYINEQCSLNCSICNRAYRQFAFCKGRGDRKRNLDIQQIEQFFNEIRHSSSPDINIMGGDIFSYPFFKELVGFMNATENKKSYFSHYLNIYSSMEMMRLLDNYGNQIKINVTFPVDNDKLRNVIDAATSLSIPYVLRFIIQNEENFSQAENYVRLFNLDNFVYLAFFNGNNIKFFEENVFIDNEDIENARPSLQAIYARGIVNPLNFGRVTVLVNGRMYSNVNGHALGIIGKDAVYSMILKELKKGKSWCKVRKNVFPCKSCTFEQICPPISNYNYIIGKNNLCWIKK